MGSLPAEPEAMTKRKGSPRLDGDAWFLRVYIAGRQRSFHLGHRRDFASKDEVHAAADTQAETIKMGISGLMRFILAGHPISVHPLVQNRGPVRQPLKPAH